MTDYIKLRIEVENSTDTITDLLAAFLVEDGFESFVPDANGLTAYIPYTLYNDANVEAIIANFPIAIEANYSHETIIGKDWNEEWEKNYFQPIEIDDECIVRSSFHNIKSNARYEIIIDPKMAFGTGHHSTTSLILRNLLASDVHGKHIIDMGTGTGILAILCGMKGAESVVGIEIDNGAYENALENVQLNDVSDNVAIHLGDASLLKGQKDCDLLIANINRNIILADLHKYTAAVKEGGEFIFSGFYDDDVPLIESYANSLGLKITDKACENSWAMIRLKKSKIEP